MPKIKLYFFDIPSLIFEIVAKLSIPYFLFYLGTFFILGAYFFDNDFNLPIRLYFELDRNSIEHCKTKLE